MNAAVQSLVNGQLPGLIDWQETFTAMLRGELGETTTRTILQQLSAIPLDTALLAQSARILKTFAVPCPAFPHAVDVCGTGGDGAKTLNISTATAFVLAACGVMVVKHGNRAVSSQSGSSDVLTVLGIAHDTSPEIMARQGLVFLFAPRFYPCLGALAPVRKALAVRTIFNVLGPLCNPAGVHYHLVGVYDVSIARTMAEALRENGSTHAYVVHSEDGLDEISVCARTHIVSLENGIVQEWQISPSDAGLPLHPPGALAGGDAAHNAEALRVLLNGAPSAYRDAVVLNTAAALMMQEGHRDLASSVARAIAAIDSGAAHTLLANLSSGSTA